MLAAFDFYEFFSDPARLAITLAATVVPIAVVAIVAYWQLAAKRMDCELKRRLAERGFSVDEIERIVRAGGEEDKSPRQVAGTGPRYGSA